MHSIVEEMFLFLTVMTALRAVDGFNSAGPTVFVRHGRALTRSNSLLPSVVRTGTSLSSTTSNVTTTDLKSGEMRQKEQLAKEALEKLLEKQRKQMQTTQDLIDDLRDAGSRSNKEESKEGGDAKTKGSTAMMLSESIYAGADYGFLSRSEGPRVEDLDDLNEELFKGYGPPSNILSLGFQQLMRNLNAMKGEYEEEENVNLTPKQRKLQATLKELTLNSTAIWEREGARGEIVAPFIIKIPYYVLCYILDVVFEGKYVFSRFFLLETVARMPYFSYITMLHLYETLGFWRRSSEVKRVHFAEEWNEYHHLLVMESLGGDQAWWVRFTAQHSALVYFLVLTSLWALSPSLSYKFSEMLETHAVDTYGQFIDENAEVLKKLPPSLAAVEYYTLGISDPLFGEYQTSAIASGGEIRKPGKNMRSLYDVFTAIRNDEGDHVGTMKACLDPNVAVLSPSLETRVLTGLALAASVGFYITTGDFTSTEVTGTEILEGIDDTLLADPVIDGLVGGAVALFQGLKETQEGAIGREEVEGAVEMAEEVAGLGALSLFLDAVRRVLIGILEIIIGWIL